MPEIDGRESFPILVQLLYFPRESHHFQEEGKVSSTVSRDVLAVTRVVSPGGQRRCARAYVRTAVNPPPAVSTALPARPAGTHVVRRGECPTGTAGTKCECVDRHVSPRDPAVRSTEG